MMFLARLRPALWSTCWGSDEAAGPAATPGAGPGAGIAAYHNLIEWRPSLDTGSCDLSGPSCTAVWFREFGFISLATMALVGFVSILALVWIRFPAPPADDDASRSIEELETV